MTARRSREQMLEVVEHDQRVPGPRKRSTACLATRPACGTTPMASASAPRGAPGAPRRQRDERRAVLDLTFEDARHVERESSLPDASGPVNVSRRTSSRSSCSATARTSSSRRSSVEAPREAGWSDQPAPISSTSCGIAADGATWSASAGGRGSARTSRGRRRDHPTARGADQLAISVSAQRIERGHPAGEVRGTLRSPSSSRARRRRRTCARRSAAHRDARGPSRRRDREQLRRTALKAPSPRRRRPAAARRRRHPC